MSQHAIQIVARRPEGMRHAVADLAAFPADSLRTILPEQIDWRQCAAFPPEVRLATLVGRPLERGPYIVRVKVPHGVKLMPHRHVEDRVYTVISGVFHMGVGNYFNADRLKAYPPGAMVILPRNTPHFYWAKSGEYVNQITGIGPLRLEYISSSDDPRNFSPTLKPRSAA